MKLSEVLYLIFIFNLETKTGNETFASNVPDPVTNPREMPASLRRIGEPLFRAASSQSTFLCSNNTFLLRAVLIGQSERTHHRLTSIKSPVNMAVNTREATNIIACGVEGLRLTVHFASKVFTNLGLFAFLKQCRKK